MRLVAPHVGAGDGAWRRARVVAGGVMLSVVLVVALVRLGGDSEPVADLSWSNSYDDGSGDGRE